MPMQPCPTQHGYRCHYCREIIEPGQMMEKRYTFFMAGHLVVRMVEYGVCGECAKDGRREKEVCTG